MIAQYETARENAAIRRADPLRPRAIISLTPAQRSAVAVYALDAALPEDEGKMTIGVYGATLTLRCDVDAARAMIADAANSAGEGDGVTPDRRAERALMKVLEKLRPMNF